VLCVREAGAGVKRLGMGLVGPGFVGAHLIDAVRRLGFVDVVAVAASTEASARRKADRSEEHTSELQSRFDPVCRLLLEKKKPCRKGRPHLSPRPGRRYACDRARNRL